MHPSQIAKLMVLQRRLEGAANEVAEALGASFGAMQVAIAVWGERSARALAAEQRANFLFWKGEAIAARLLRVEARLARAIRSPAAREAA